MLSTAAGVGVVVAALVLLLFLIGGAVFTRNR